MDAQTALEIKKAAERLQEGDQQGGIAILRSILKRDGNVEQAWYLLAMALDDPQKKEYALRQVLRINPYHDKAQAQLGRLVGAAMGMPQPETAPKPAEEKPPKKVESAQEARVTEEPSASKEPSAIEEPVEVAAPIPAAAKKKPAPRRGISCLGMLAVASAVALLAAGGAYAVLGGFSNPSNNSDAVATSVNGDAAMTLPPTWTITPTYTPLGTLEPSATPTITPTSTAFPLSAEIEAEMETIRLQVSELTGLDIREDVHNEIMPKLKLQLLLTDLFITDEYLATLPDEGYALTALGFIQPEYDLVQSALDSKADYIGGFYLPENNEIYIIGTGFFGIEKYIYSHEFMHALQDQHFDLTSLGVYPECTLAAQNCMAIRALVEGQAEYVQNLWWQSFATAQDFADISRYVPPTTLFQEEAPPYFSLSGSFPYFYGGAFVDTLYQRDGWNEVNDAFSRLPDTTEQIIHPEKYVAREQGIEVNDPDLDQALGEGWRRLRRDALGEWETFLLLAYGVDEQAQIAEEQAVGAAEGWGGDTYQVYRHDGNSQTVLAAHWTWDNNSHKDEFYAALSDYLGARYRGANISDTCWLVEGEMSCIYDSGREVLWILAPDLGTLEQIFGLFPEFQ